ncbi:MAG TPA: metallophosphoesterase [Lachnospiraceae bacterium]|nr:metallophosphoesterase [Lachnospiraceae bacterium]
MDFITKEYTIKTKKVSEPVSILFTADLHNASYGPENEDLFRACRAVRPDMILCAGDMLIGRRDEPFETASHAMRFFASLAPTFFANGNHETRVKDYEDCRMYEDYIGQLKDAGVCILNNAGRAFEAGANHFQIYGLELPVSKYIKFHHPELSAKEMRDSVGSVLKDPGVYTILIAHNPYFAPVYYEWGADLTVSGHFHGGIVRTLSGNALIDPYGFMFPKYGYGSFEKLDRHMIVTSGLGDHFLPFRIGNPWEIVHISLEPC